MARLSFNSRDAKAVVFTSPADASHTFKHKPATLKSSDAPSPLGYTLCSVCGHVSGLKKSTFSDKEATPPIKYGQPVLAKHSVDGYKTSRTYGRYGCIGSETTPTNPIFQNPKES